jgi:FSR family fosmidomycin resistance protein-like MFS transporter
VYSLTHFLVDFACAFLMFRAISSAPSWYTYLLLYNFCAFAAQMPLGVLADKINKNFIFAIGGCALIAVAYGLGAFPLAAVLFLGLGNGLFHIGGGIDVLNVSEGKAGLLGVFVSPGAFGIYFGMMLGRGSVALAFAIILALIIAIVFVLAMRLSLGSAYPHNSPFTLKSEVSNKLPLVALCLFAVVVLRSYSGLSMSFPWRSEANWGIVLVCAVVFGKTLGGFVSDRLGAIKTACASLGLAALLFLLAQIPLAGIAAVFLFNMTMPLTLWAMAKILPGAKGFAFGLLTFALFLGFLPPYFGATFPASAGWLFAIASLLSLVLLYLGLRKANL